MLHIQSIVKIFASILLLSICSYLHANEAIQAITLQNSPNSHYLNQDQIQISAFGIKLSIEDQQQLINKNTLLSINGKALLLTSLLEMLDIKPLNAINHQKYMLPLAIDLTSESLVEDSVLPEDKLALVTDELPLSRDYPKTFHDWLPNQSTLLTGAYIKIRLPF